MEKKDFKINGYRTHYYGFDGQSNTKQCFNCKFGRTVKENREKVKCEKWNMVVNEDDICDSFEFRTYWAFDCTNEDRERRKQKLEKRVSIICDKSEKEMCMRGWIFAGLYVGIIVFIMLCIVL